MAREIERALAFFVRRRRGARRGLELPAVEGLSPVAFRAVVDERLRALERQLDEVKGRINGLLFLLAGAVATQVVLRLFA
jgi:hypothetical protein